MLRGWKPVWKNQIKSKHVGLLPNRPKVVQRAYVSGKRALLSSVHRASTLQHLHIMVLHHHLSHCHFFFSKLPSTLTLAFWDRAGNNVTFGFLACVWITFWGSFTHNSLPYGKDLQGEELENDLTEVADIFVQSAEKLAPLGSSQANEALNNTIGSKAPKIRHCGTSKLKVMTTE